MPEASQALYSDLCQLILQRHQDELPDLHNIQVILPTQSCCRQFRLQLLKQLPDGLQAVLAPECDTLSSWVNRLVPAIAGIQVHSHPLRLLHFIDALQQHPELFHEDNQWQVADALLKLFDELWMHDAQLPGDIDDWQQLLQSAYQAESVNRHLSQEAGLVHTLWLAWQQQLAASANMDPAQFYASQLQQAVDRIDARHIYLGEHNLAPVETDFVNKLVAGKLCTLVNPYDQVRPHQEFIDTCFDTSSELLTRSNSLQQQQAPDLLLYKAINTEYEIGAIRLQLMNWLAAGKTDIAVICEDRKLSRRLRAVLEQYGLQLQDEAGWSLSTTSAAAVLVRWLECIETDFDQQPLLDLLKSRFVLPGESEDKLETVFRFERDLVRHENVASNLDRYRYQLDKRQQRLQEKFNWKQQHYLHILELIDALELASNKLVALHKAATRRPAVEFLQATLDSLQQIGLSATFESDAAGQQVMSVLTKLIEDASHSDTGFLWRDFRLFLSSQLEQELFTPGTGDHRVRLMTLEQSAQLEFDAVVIAAAESKTYPGSANSSPFFNQSVRHSLGLEDWAHARQRRLTAFKRLLCQDIPFLLTCRKENDGDPVPPSPWVEALSQFYQLAFDHSLESDRFSTLVDEELEACINQLATQRQHTAKSHVLENDVPQRISTSAHQRLVDCPYRFFTADILGLRIADEIIIELQKSDYGERIHRALQVFHSRQENMPEPFGQPVTLANRDNAIAHLDMISQHVFQYDMDANALHRSWLTRWRGHIPAYIDWQIKRQEEWSVSRTEKQAERTIDNQHSLYGRLDRIDQSSSDGSFAIVDYKTGKAPSIDDVLSGENIQLSSYSLLHDNTSSVTYLELDKQGNSIGDKTSLQHDELEEISSLTEKRLKLMLKEIGEGGELPAWGDVVTCSYCEYSGVCRRAYSEENQPR